MATGKLPDKWLENDTMGGEISAPEAPAADNRMDDDCDRAAGRHAELPEAFTYCMYMNRVTKTVECVETTNFTPPHYEYFNSCVVEQTPRFGYRYV